MPKPIVHLFHLGVHYIDIEKFLQIGLINFITSYKNEPGTLVMQLSQLKKCTTEFIVFEMYASNNAYQIHCDSPQYQAYMQQIGHKLIKKKAYTVELVCMVKKEACGICIDSNNYCQQLTEIQIDIASTETFDMNMTTYMNDLKKENSVFSLYLLKDTQHAGRYYLYEIYTDAKAYEIHHKMTSSIAIKSLVLSKESITLENKIAVVKE